MIKRDLWTTILNKMPYSKTMIYFRNQTLSWMLTVVLQSVLLIFYVIVGRLQGKIYIAVTFFWYVTSNARMFSNCAKHSGFLATPLAFFEVLDKFALAFVLHTLETFE